MSRVAWTQLRPAEDAEAVREAIDRVLDRGWFVLGPEVEAFEGEFSAATGNTHTVGVASGTDALILALRGLGIGPGDEVITTALSAVYTAQAIMMTGARPVFADLDRERLTLDPKIVASLIGPRTAAILPVHLYGQPADMPALAGLADQHGLALVEDCAQAHLAECAGRPVGSFGIAAAYSFYPTKNLGALGDGGAVTTRDQALAKRVRQLRVGGQSARDRHTEASPHSRLDELQAAILRARLPFLSKWTTRRRALGQRYRDGLTGADLQLPPQLDAGHVYHLFPVRSTRRDELRTHLSAAEIDTLVHYAVPMPAQPAFASTAPAPCPIADQVCGELVSLPLYPALSSAAVDRVVDVLRGW